MPRTPSAEGSQVALGTGSAARSDRPAWASGAWSSSARSGRPIATPGPGPAARLETAGWPHSGPRQSPWLICGSDFGPGTPKELWTALQLAGRTTSKEVTERWLGLVCATSGTLWLLTQAT